MGDDLEIWFEETLRGFLALRTLDAAAAAASWQRALDLASGVELRNTPFHAVAATNLAVSRALAAERSDMDAGRHAAAAWAELTRRLERDDMPLPARSSVFHLKLAGTHAAPFTAYLRGRALTLVRLGAALAEANDRPDANDLPLYDDPAAPGALPEFLLGALRAHQSGNLGRPVALDLLECQIDHLRGYGTALPRTFRAQLEACLGFCAFAPLIAGLDKDGAFTCRRSDP